MKDETRSEFQAFASNFFAAAEDPGVSGSQLIAQCQEREALLRDQLFVPWLVDFVRGSAGAPDNSESYLIQSSLVQILAAVVRLLSHRVKSGQVLERVSNALQQELAAPPAALAFKCLIVEFEMAPSDQRLGVMERQRHVWQDPYFEPWIEGQLAREIAQHVGSRPPNEGPMRDLSELFYDLRHTVESVANKMYALNPQYGRMSIDDPKIYPIWQALGRIKAQLEGYEKVAGYRFWEDFERIKAHLEGYERVPGYRYRDRWPEPRPYGAPVMRPGCAFSPTPNLLDELVVRWRRRLRALRLLPTVNLSTPRSHPQDVDERTKASAMEWIGILAGENWTDAPMGVSLIVTAFVGAINGGLDDENVVAAQTHRNRLLRPLIPRILDSKSTSKVEEKRAFLGLNFLVREAAPLALDSIGLRRRGATIRALPQIVDSDTESQAFAELRLARDEALHLDPPRPGDKLNNWDRGEDAGKALSDILEQSVTSHYSTHEILRFLSAAMFGHDKPANQIPIYEAAVMCVERMLATTTV